MAEFHELAKKQRGHLDRPALQTIGMTDEQIQRLVEAKHWQRPHPGVYRTGSASPMWEDKVRAAVLAAGAGSRAMGRTAARLHGLDSAERHSVIELTVPYGHGPVPAGVIVRRTRRLDPSLTSHTDGIPVSCVGATLLEYAWLVHVSVVVERAIEDAFRRGKSSEGSLRRFIAAHGGRGVPGVTHLRAILDNRPEGRPARSGFEVIVLDILREHGLRLPIRRPLVKAPPDHVFELDLAYVAEKIDIEPMGAKWHSTRAQRARDDERSRVLAPLGWQILPVVWDEAVTTPWSVADRTRAALERSVRIYPS